MILNDKIEYEIELYEDSAGHSDIDDFLNILATKALKNKYFCYKNDKKFLKILDFIIKIYYNVIRIVIKVLKK